MATQTDVRRISLSIPETREKKDNFAFEVLHGKKYKNCLEKIGQTGLHQLLTQGGFAQAPKKLRAKYATAAP